MLLQLTITIKVTTEFKMGAGLYVPLPECTGTLFTIFGSYVPYIGYIRIMVGLLLRRGDLAQW